MPRYYYKGRVPVPVDLGDGNVISIAPKTEFEAPAHAIRGKLKKDTVKLPDKKEEQPALVPASPAPAAKPAAPKPVATVAKKEEEKKEEKPEEKPEDKSGEDTSTDGSNKGRRRSGR